MESKSKESNPIGIVNRLGSVFASSRRSLHYYHVVVSLVLLLATIVRLFLFYSVPDIMKSDETLYGHMAYYALYGSGFGFWMERSYFYPMILLSVIVFSHPGLTHVWDPYLLIVTRGFNLAMNVLCVLLTFFIGRTIGGTNVGLLASFLLSICWLDAFWGFRAVSEVPATLFLLISLLFTARGLILDSRKRFFLAGLFLGFSFMVRFQSVLLFVPVAVLLSQRRTHLRYALSGLVLAILIQGLVDLVSWGSFLSSPWNFLVLNILSGGSARWGIRPLLYYFERIPGIVGWNVILFAVLTLFSLNSHTSFFWMIVATHVTVFSLVAHKERRFLIPILPVFFLLAALGFVQFEKRLQRPEYRILLSLLLLLPELFLSLDTISAIVAREFLVP